MLKNTDLNDEYAWFSRRRDTEDAQEALHGLKTIQNLILENGVRNRKEKEKRTLTHTSIKAILKVGDRDEHTKSEALRTSMSKIREPKLV